MSSYPSRIILQVKTKTNGITAVIGPNGDMISKH